MLRLLASGLVVASVLAGSAAHGEEGALVSVRDRHGDVKVEGSAEGVDPAVVNSIDIRHVTVTRERDGVRIVVRLKKVLPVRGRWNQEVAVMVAPPSWSGPTWFLMAFAVPQHLGTASAIYSAIGDEEDEEDNGDTDVYCRATASKGTKVVSMTIPDRCLPQEAGELTVTSVLLDKHDEDDPLIAQDELGVGALVDLQPGR